MTGPVRMVLAFLPLASYFGLLGKWQNGKRPRVISGPRDFLLLAFALGGLIAFGPVGQILVSTVFPRPSLSAWMAVASLTSLLAMVGASRARKRLVVYHVEADELDHALGRAMESVAGFTTRTIHGYEDVLGRRGVTVEIGRRLRFGVIEAYGEGAESLIVAVRPALISQLATVSPRPSHLGTILYALGCATFVLPIAAVVISRPDVQAALRKIRGG
jgi:hypothetical protein